jgi:hypothetical protein
LGAELLQTSLSPFQASRPATETATDGGRTGGLVRGAAVLARSRVWVGLERKNRWGMGKREGAPSRVAQRGRVSYLFLCCGCVSLHNLASLGPREKDAAELFAPSPNPGRTRNRREDHLQKRGRGRERERERGDGDVMS